VQPATPADPKALEDQKVSGAIRTDFILSAEIMAITLATVPTEGIVMQAVVLAIVAVAITAVVYGVVALTVKADDVGLRLALNQNRSVASAFGRAIGHGLVKGMPVLLQILSALGTAAMIWVGGGIISHGLEEYGITAVAHAIHALSDMAGSAVPQLMAVAKWTGAALGAGIFGLGLGLILIPIVTFVIVPLRMVVARVLGKKDRAQI
jgi:predicted DNA repair protein MutK